MKHFATVILFLVTGFLHWAHGQETAIYTHADKDYQKALDLYNNKQYQASQAIFRRVGAVSEDPEVQANSAYYVANAAIRLNQTGADKLMESFVERYPTSTKRNTAFMDVADYYFETGKYPYALKWYRKADVRSLGQKDRERFDFNNGYALFNGKNYKGAEQYFNKVSHTETYGSQAKYYLGYMAYEQDDYDTANQRFDQIQDPELLEEKLSYYQADMNFKLGKFEEAIRLAKQHLPKADRKEISELNKIIGESYFNLKQYGEAVPYLEKYKGKRGKWSNTDYYLLGYSHYKQGDYAGAIGQFNKIVGGTNAVAQNAYYHLAECYLKLDKKQEALNAFRNASQMDFSAEITKDAHLNYAKLGYEVGNPYESVPETLMAYLKKYPDDPQEDKIKELLVDSYVSSGNYEGALELLDKNRGFATDAVYQKVAFLRASELFYENNYLDAFTYFEKARAVAADPTYTARSQYWEAESLYVLGRYPEAVNGFEGFKRAGDQGLEEWAQVDYQLGYAHYKQKAYAEAGDAFKNFTDRNAALADLQNDGLMRLADCYFVTSKYWPALETYNLVLSKPGASGKDYATYQKALSYGFVDRVEKKIGELRGFDARYPKSRFKEEALFELGNTYIKKGDRGQGLQIYDKIVRQFPKSKVAPKALMRKGLTQYNANQNEAALNTFKQVVAKYPGTQEAVQAVSSAKLVYVDLGRVGEYADWAKGLDFVEVSDAELDEASFEAANRALAEGKEKTAIKQMEAYVAQFPNGLHAMEARFNLAQLYFGKGEYDKALTHFKLVGDSSNEYSEQALTRTCEIYIGKEDYGAAMPYLHQLETTALIPQNVSFAQSNLMKGYYGQKQYDKTLEYAQKVLASPGIDDRIKADAHTMIARSARETGDMSRAREAYTEVLKFAKGGEAAEALYYDAYFKNQHQDFEESNAAVQKLAKEYSGYKEWGGKGLVLMAQNFYALGDAFQATYILESVIKNFADYQEITEKAQTELSKIKTKEAMTNSSVNPNEN
ncbi:tetratricopeptide repeat protein [Sediminicola luteus]|uniref:Uncharacterized protein n=1 Tax=Sediminicola luteus TaxID=319238 RepID=A0A2A4G9I4_9FLAO|nr:tetratricopeptide repeat protein [Sediminicola luteus]PCE64422.1 hypothetical protein B7P33_09030 [Sediminicola luteus]